MDVEFFIFGMLLIMAVLVVFGVYGLLFEWLPDHLRRRRATASERATEWVNAHPIQPKVRRIR